MYGCHPYHHIGMPGTVIIREERRQRVPQGRHAGTLERRLSQRSSDQQPRPPVDARGGLQQFLKRYQLPGCLRVIDWHRAVRGFFRTKDRAASGTRSSSTPTRPRPRSACCSSPRWSTCSTPWRPRPSTFLPGGHFNNSVDGINRPQRWTEGEGHFAIEFFGTPEGVVGKPTLGDAEKAKRPVAAILQVPDHAHRRHPRRPSRPAPSRRSKSSPSATASRHGALPARAGQPGLEADHGVAHARPALGPAQTARERAEEG